MENTFQSFDVATGLRLNAYKTSRFKTSRISFTMVLPLEKDASKNAMLPYILARTCKEFPTYMSLSKKLADLYGATLTPSVGKIGESHVLRLSMNMIDNKFALSKDEDIILSCVELILKVILEPNAENGAFDKEEVDRARRLLLEKIESQKSDKRIYALQRLIEEMCKDEAFSSKAIGTKEGLLALTPESVYEAYRHLVENAFISVNIIGNTDVDKVREMLVEKFSKITRNEPAPTSNEIITRADEVKRVEESLPVNQGKLVMGFRYGCEDEADVEKRQDEIRMMTDIFGGGTYSRLFMNVREKMSLCYYCSARPYRQKALFIVQSGVENENIETAIEEIQNQLKSMAEGGVTEEDMNASRLSMKDTFNSVCDTPEDIDGWISAQVTDAHFETPEEVYERTTKVTREDIIRAAGKVTLDTIFVLKAEGEE